MPQKLYSVTFYCDEREIASAIMDQPPLVGDKLVVNDYIGANAHRNGTFVIEHRMWVFGPQKMDEHVLDLIVARIVN